MIKLEHVKKVYNKYKKNRLNVINDTTLEFNETGLVALLGPSGCGKTTLLNVIGGLDKVNKGRIYIDGKKITRVSSHRIDKIRNLSIGYIFQDYKLIDSMTVYDNVAIVLKMLGVKDKKEIENRVLYVLDKVNMLRYKRRPVTMLSGGERQRVGIARAIVKDPKIIIADEPTGNLDSRNSIEVMNIIKKISKNRLVVLVTHEEELAKFYGERIIELQDGSVIKDYKNTETRSLDYRIDNKIYLKDFNVHNSLKKDDIKVDIYSEEKEKVKLDIVFKNGNIYIKSNSNDNLKIVENNIELINDHYKEIKNVNENDEFDLDSVSNKHYKRRYSSIFRLGSFITRGFKTILDYPFVKKILLAGFFLSGVFILYAVSSTFAVLDIQEKNFVKINKNYLIADAKNINLEDYLFFENSKNTSYMLPGDSLVSFSLKMNKYYQTINFDEYLNGSLTSIRTISDKDIIYGNIPVNNREIVVDKMILNNLIKKGLVRQVGVKSPKEFLGETVSLEILGKFSIVGVTDKNCPNIYAFDDMLINIISNSNMNEANSMSVYEDDYMNGPLLVDYNLNTESYKLSKGRMPLNDNEIIVSSNKEFEMPLNKTINQKVNGEKLRVVGYFTSEADYQERYITNPNTVKNNLITSSEHLVVMSNNKAQSITEFTDRGLFLKDSYETEKEKYKNKREDSVKKTFIVCGIIVLISFLEILLMIRSSFLSRVKEVGIYRAIGVKKSDIYKMFVGEIIGITVMSSTPGVLLMSYVLYNLNQIEYINGMFMINVFTVLLSLLIVFTFNIVVGLIPVFTIMKKTPAQILSRQDVN